MTSNKFIILIYICFISSISLGLAYQSGFDINPVFNEFKKEYQAYSKELKEKQYQAYLNSLSGWQRFKNEVIRLSEIHHFSPNVPIAQCAEESGRGTSYFAKYRNNFCGIGAFDSDPNQALTFNTPEDHARYWVSLMQKPLYKDAWKNRKDPVAMITHIKLAGYATSPDYISKVMKQPEFKSL